MLSSPYLCLHADRSDERRPECGAQQRAEERERSPADGAPEQGAQAQTAGDGERRQVQVQGYHHSLGSKDSTAGRAVGHGDQVCTRRNCLLYQLPSLLEF